MKHVLIITEDIIKIQTLSGTLGGLFRLIYLNWLAIRLRLTIGLLRPWFKLTVLTADAFPLPQADVFYYGNELARIDFAAKRREYLNITDRLVKGLPQPLFKIRLAAHLTYDYFVYTQVFQSLIKKINPDLVVTLSASYHEQIAGYLAQSQKIKTVKFHWLTFIWLNHWLKQFFLRRQYQQKINQFMRASETPEPFLDRLRSATLLSLDFSRHFKTLAPVYRALAEHQLNPWLVTDINRVSPVLKNFHLASARHFFLASWLPAGFRVRPARLPGKLDTVKNLDDRLFNLGLSAAGPMIELGQVLSQLYLAAAENLFQQVKPKAVVVVSDLRFCELALAAMAKKTQTRSVLVSPNTLLALDQLNGYNTTDKIAVVGGFVKQQLLNLDIDPAKISIVGDPQTENYHQLKLDQARVYQALKINPAKKIALLISFGPSQMIPQPEKEAFFRLASRAVVTQKNTVLVIKPHPSEKRYRILEELRQWGMTRAVVSDNSQLELVELLQACSVVLQTWSMTIFEAIMMNRPVLVVNPFRKSYGTFLPIIKDGGAVEVFNLNQLKKHLAILLDPRQRQTRIQLLRARQACARFIAAPDGQTAEKIIKLLFG